jgi:hypothetical protein
VIALAVPTLPKLLVLSRATEIRLPSALSSVDEPVLRRVIVPAEGTWLKVKPSAADAVPLAEAYIEARGGKTTLGARSNGDNFDDCDSWAWFNTRYGCVAGFTATCAACHKPVNACEEWARTAVRVGEWDCDTEFNVVVAPKNSRPSWWPHVAFAGECAFTNPFGSTSTSSELERERKYARASAVPISESFDPDVVPNDVASGKMAASSPNAIKEASSCSNVCVPAPPKVNTPTRQ